MKDYIKKTISFYDANVEDYFENTVNLQFKEWIDKFISYLPHNAKVLDLGCAFGRDVKYFVEHNLEALGVDLSSKMIEKAKRFEPLAKFFVMDMSDLKFDQNSFDGVWCSATLLHLSKTDALIALDQIKKVLKNNGLLY